MKKTYIEPKVEVSEFKNVDIICASGIPADMFNGQSKGLEVGSATMAEINLVD